MPSYGHSPGCSSTFVLFSRFTISLIRFSTRIFFTSLSRKNDTWPTSMPAVFFKFSHIVYTTSTLFILLPEMLFALTNWAASSMTALGMSSMVWPLERKIVHCQRSFDAIDHRLPVVNADTHVPTKLYPHETKRLPANPI